MQLTRLIGFALTLILLIAGFWGIPYPGSADAQDANLEFQWAFGALKKANGAKFEAVTRDTVLKTGDQIKFFLNVSQNNYAYLIYRSSQGGLSVLFPKRFQLQSTEYTAAGNHYIPADDQWFFMG